MIALKHAWQSLPLTWQFVILFALVLAIALSITRLCDPHRRELRAVRRNRRRRAKAMQVLGKPHVSVQRDAFLYDRKGVQR